MLGLEAILVGASGPSEVCAGPVSAAVSDVVEVGPGKIRIREDRSFDVRVGEVGKLQISLVKAGAGRAGTHPVGLHEPAGREKSPR